MRRSSLHIINRAQLGKDEYVQLPKQIIKQCASLSVEVVPVLLPPFGDLLCRKRPLCDNGIIAIV